MTDMIERDAAIDAVTSGFQGGDLCAEVMLGVEYIRALPSHAPPPAIDRAPLKSREEVAEIMDAAWRASRGRGEGSGLSWLAAADAILSRGVAREAIDDEGVQRAAVVLHEKMSPGMKVNATCDQCRDHARAIVRAYLGADEGEGGGER